jgi:hypothetical protein
VGWSHIRRATQQISLRRSNIFLNSYFALENDICTHIYKECGTHICGIQIHGSYTHYECMYNVYIKRVCAHHTTLLQYNKVVSDIKGFTILGTNRHGSLHGTNYSSY